jgi:hypothetical protein
MSFFGIGRYLFPALIGGTPPGPSRRCLGDAGKVAPLIASNSANTFSAINRSTRVVFGRLCINMHTSAMCLSTI